MVHVPWRLRFSAFASKIYYWQYVNEKVTDISKTKGLAKLLLLPGLTTVLLRAVFGESFGTQELVNIGWKKEGWVKLLTPWLSREILRADPRVTRPMKLDAGNDHSSLIVVYQGIGLASCLNRRSNQETLLTSPGGEAETWISHILALKGGGVFRLMPRRADSQSEDYGDEGSVHWDLSHTPWSEQETWIEGPWCPGASTIAKALFPEGGGGRSVLVWGPSGVGKTETTIRACRVAHGDDARVLVVHGSAFAKSSRDLSGRAAASLVKVLGASALIVDDMPPTATVALLEEVEALYREKVAVALTLMTGDEPPKLQGLRPGRADETFEFSPPGAEGRLALLQAYAPNFSWEGTAGDARAEGMTPAYLKELARRVTRGENPEAALISLHKHRAIAN